MTHENTFPSPRPISAKKRPTKFTLAEKASVVSVPPVVLDGRSLKQLPKETSASLMKYAPNMPKQHWVKISAFVLDAVAAASTLAEVNADRAVRITAPFVEWAVVYQGLPLEASSVFTTPAIEHYCRWLVEKKKLEEGSVASYRSVLRKIADCVAPAKNLEPTRAYARRNVQDPYAAAELHRYRAWAHGQHTKIQARRAKLMLSAGAGAGLRPKEIGLIRPSDVTISESGVTLSVRGDFPRQITLLSEWEDMFCDSIADIQPNMIVWGDTTNPSRDKNLITNFADRCTGVAPIPSRLRASWIVTLLDRRVHMAIIFEAGGFTQFNNLHQYIPYLAKPGTPEARTQLRRGVSE
ncbi:MAG: hypothetical protein H7288_01255 [Kineosporiaceae bacterium]|nr:hypothetical protein [Aeromicrobium sp.]